jgi:TnpA family transposase
MLQRTYSHRLSDYALEFYSFVADNYAPFYSTPIECTDRDAAYVLDGLLYNESDLALEEHYTDTHGYTEIDFAAFAMLGRRFAPRIRGLHRQRIYRIDLNRDYGPLEVLLKRRGRIIRMD